MTVVAAKLRFVGKRISAGAADLVTHKLWEGGATTLTLELSQALSYPFTISLKDSPQYKGVNDRAWSHRGVDYPVLPWSATFPAGATRAQVTVLANRDRENGENRESLYMTVPESSLPTGVIADGHLAAHIVIHNVDVRPTGPIVSFKSTSSEVQEDAGTVSLNVTVDPPPATPFALNFSLSGTATPDSDYRVAGMTGDRPIQGQTGNSGTVTVPADAGSVTIPVEIIDDTVEDDRETVVVRLLDSGGYEAVTPDSVTLTIRNDDQAPVVVLPAGHPLVKYAALVSDIRDVYILDHTDDSAHPKWKRVLKGLGDTAYAAYPEPAMAAAEATDLYDTHGWSRWAPVGAALAYAESWYAGTTTPPPTADPEVTIAAGSGVTEGTSATFTLTANPAPSAALDVTVTVATDGEFGITAGTQTVTIPTTGSFTLTLATAGDEADEADGSVSVTVDAGTGYTVGDASSGTVVIADDDAPAPETGTAHPAVDPALIAQIREWMAAPGANVAARNERFTRVLAAFGVESHANPMTVAEAEGYVRNGWGARWQRIVDALKAIEAYQAPPSTADPEVMITAGSGVTEGTSATFTLTATPAPAAALQVTVTVATDGDYGITAGERTVTIPTTGTYTLTLATAGDEVDEPDGSVSVTVDAGTGYTVGTASSGTVAIADDDLPAPEVTIAAGAGVTEGTAATFILTATPAPTAALDVTVTVATDGDYGITAGARTVTIPTTGTYTLTLATTGDEADEPDGSVSVTVDAGTGYTVGAASSATVAIADDDLPPPVVSVTAGAGVTEGGDAVFTVKADRAVDADLAVTLTVSEKAGSDFVAAADEGGKTVTILADKHTATLTVKTVDDRVDEPDGAVSATVDAGTGYTVAASPADAASVAVADNDVPGRPMVSVEDATAGEGETMQFAVRLSAPSKQTVWLRLMSQESTPASASLGRDFQYRRQMVRFRPGQTALQFGVRTFNDSHDDGGETFEVKVVYVHEDTAGIADGVAVGTIENDDPLPGGVSGAVRAHGGGAGARRHRRAAVGGAHAGDAGHAGRAGARLRPGGRPVRRQPRHAVAALAHDDRARRAARVALLADRGAGRLGRQPRLLGPGEPSALRRRRARRRDRHRPRR